MIVSALINNFNALEEKAPEPAGRHLDLRRRTWNYIDLDALVFLTEPIQVKRRPS